MCNDADMRPNLPEVTTGSRGKQEWVMDDIISRQILVIMVLVVLTFRIMYFLICFMNLCISFMYLIYVQ